MSIGTGIVLFVIGAILTFAIHIQNAFINVQLVGYILMGAGLVVFIVGLVFMLRKRQSITTVRSGVDADGQSVSQRRTSVTPDDEL
ncbi:MAG: hypothetical protein JWR36_1445 [Glaciihabitans sp.]|jgi:hypothetical protein|nr:hypothetical protein [Glaciihabitans sp.]MDQ1571996.1 hypothetical protein [Actinomycetota bacterium]